MQFPVRLILLLLLFITGCGGSQSSDNRPLGWSEIQDAIPAGADALFLSRPDKAVSELLSQIGGTSWTDLLSTSNTKAMIGFDLKDSASVAAVGIDPNATSAVVALTSGPIFIFKLADKALFASKLKELVERQPDQKPETFLLGGAKFTRIELGSSFSFEVGVKDGFAFGRVRIANFESMTASDGDMRTLFLGAGDSPFWESAEGRAILADSGGSLPQSVSFLRTRALTRLTDGAVQFFNGDAGKLVPATAPTAPYRDAAQRTLCRGIVERMSATLPWSSSVSLSVLNPSTGGLAVQSKVRAQFSDRGAEDWKTILKPAAGASLPGTENGWFYGAGHLDLRRFLALFDAPAEAATCPDTAKVLALISIAKASRAKQVQLNIDAASGEAAIGLFGIRMAGLFPLVDAGLMLGAPAGKGVQLAKLLQAEFRKNGAEGTVDTTSPYLRVDYRLLIYRFSLFQKDDRVVVTIGKVPESTIGAMLNGQASADEPVADIHVNGVRIAEDGIEMLNFYAEMGSLSAEQKQIAEEGLKAVGWLERGDGSLAWSDSTLMGSMSFQLVPPVAKPAEANGPEL